MLSNLNLREAYPHDARALLDIYSYYVENTAITFELETPTESEFRQRIENTLKNYPYYVAEQNGSIVGYCYAGVFKARSAYLHSAEVSIYVEKAQRRCGIGRALYNILERTLVRQNIGNLYACIAYPRDTDDPFLSTDSVSFHSRLGYSTVGHFTECAYKFDRYYDMIWMEKLLGAKASRPGAFLPFSEL